jgi:hypothetical protein
LPRGGRGCVSFALVGDICDRSSSLLEALFVGELVPADDFDAVDLPARCQQRHCQHKYTNTNKQMKRNSERRKKQTNSTYIC